MYHACAGFVRLHILHLMKHASLKAKLTITGLIAILVTGVLTVGFAVFFFRSEVARLYREDYSERIRNIEFEYRELQDAIQGEAAGTDADTSATTSPTPRVPSGGAATSSTDTQADAQQDWGGRGSRRDTLLQRLTSRFLDGRTLEGQLFIFNGDGDVMLSFDGGYMTTSDLIAAAFDSIATRSPGDVEHRIDGRRYWIVYSYFEPWDWYTGFLLPQSVRFAGVVLFTWNVGLAVVVFMLLFAAAYIRFLARTLKPFSAIPVAMQRFLQGDIEQRLEVRTHDEVGQISESFNEFVGQLRTMLTAIRSACDKSTLVETELTQQSHEAERRINSIRENATSMRAGIRDLSQNIGESSDAVGRIDAQVRTLNDSVDEQSAAVEQSTAAIEQMSASLDSVASITVSRRQGVVELKERAAAGSAQLAELQESISSVTASVDDIAGFVGVIRGIASQTNLLSMNASIEAAHAGDAGRGFAVVAEEIRKLASAAGESSSQITAVIKSVLTRIESVNRISSETGSAFSSIEQEIHSVSDSFEEIASATAELSSGSKEIRTAMSLLSDVSSRVQTGTAESLSATRQIATAMDTVTTLTERMVSSVSAINEQTELSVADLSTIANTAEALSESVAALEEAIRGFQRPEQVETLEDFE